LGGREAGKSDTIAKEGRVLSEPFRRRKRMSMRKVAFRELSRDVRSFLTQVRNGEGIVVEDDKGRARYGIIPYLEATMEERAEARKRIKRLQRKVAKAMKAQGVTEEDVERLLEDD
jgi:hypothetical protein